VVNPFDPSRLLLDEKGVFADGAKLRKRRFLFRAIDFETPFQGRLVYDSWWFLQRVTIDGIRVWSRISWLRIEREMEFALPKEVDAQCTRCRIEINFGIALSIRRFQVTVAGITAYDEIC